jgi:hypothetical protein
MNSGASHRYGVIGDRALCVDVLILSVMNLGSRAHYIGTGGGAYYLLIKGIAPDQGMGR